MPVESQWIGMKVVSPLSHCCPLQQLVFGQTLPLNLQVLYDYHATDSVLHEVVLSPFKQPKIQITHHFRYTFVSLGYALLWPLHGPVGPCQWEEEDDL